MKATKVTETSVTHNFYQHNGWIQGECRLWLTEGLRMWLKPSRGKRWGEMSGGWTKSTPKSSWTFTKKTEIHPCVLRKSSGAFQEKQKKNPICTNMGEQKSFIKITISKQFICMGQLLVSQEKERTGYSANWLLLVKDFLQIYLNTPSIILLPVEYLLGLLAFQVVEFWKIYVLENSLFIMVSW